MRHELEWYKRDTDAQLSAAGHRSIVLGRGPSAQTKVRTAVCPEKQSESEKTCGTRGQKPKLTREREAAKQITLECPGGKQHATCTHACESASAVTPPPGRLPTFLTKQTISQHPV